MSKQRVLLRCALRSTVSIQGDLVLHTVLIASPRVWILICSGLPMCTTQRIICP